MLDKLHGRDFAFDLHADTLAREREGEREREREKERDLINHLVLEDFVLVEDLDGEFFSGLDVSSKLHFGECSLA